MLAMCLAPGLAAQQIGLKHGLDVATKDAPLVPSGVVFQAPERPAQTGARSASAIQIGRAENPYTALLSGARALTYSPELNTVAFIRRQNAADHGGVGAGNSIRFDVSTDGGANWELSRLLTPNMFANNVGDVTGIRYPSGAIFNPPGNTDPNAAFVVAQGSALTSLTGSWGKAVEASSRINGDDAIDVYVDPFENLTSFHPYGLHYANNGRMWSFSTKYSADDVQQQYMEFKINRGTWNSDETRCDWDFPETYSPPFSPVIDAPNLVTGWNIAFSPDGQIGYAYIMTKLLSGPPLGPYPVIWKTTDAGDTWTQLPLYDFSQMEVFQNNLFFANGSEAVRPWFSETACTVDADGRLHLFSEVLSGARLDPDSAGYVFISLESQHLFHSSTLDGTDWTVNKVSDIYNEDGEVWEGVFATVRPGITRTDDGNHLILTWSSSGQELDQNVIPDVYAVAYDVAGQRYTAQKNLTLNSDAEGTAYWYHVSPICITGGDDFDLEVPLVYMEPGPTDVDPVQFFYLKGAGFNLGDFNVGINELNAKGSLEIFPNPGSGVFNLMMNDLGTVDIVVSDIAGRNVYGTRVNRTQHVIDLSGNPAGMYIVTATGNDSRVTKKLILE